MEEGGGSGWSQGEGARHGADSGRGERARQEAGRQGFGEMLLQSQLGLREGGGDTVRQPAAGEPPASAPQARQTAPRQPLPTLTFS